MQSVQRTLPSIQDGISPRDFDRLAKFIYSYSGIKMPPTKVTMLEGRLRKRLRVTGHANFDAYCSYLFKDGGLEAETIHLIDAVTTNKTDFFREPNHFQYMVDKILPELLGQRHREIRTWSSACSIGAEPYTIAMVLDAYFQEMAPDTRYQILATDLSTDVLRTAHKGIYTPEMVAPVPPVLRQRYVMQSRDKNRNEVRIHPRLRARVGFGRLNLMDDKYPVGDLMHMIFCRNVMIYFDKQTQAGVLSRLCDCLRPGGYLFIGHSETIAGFDLPLVTVANTVFQRV
ncbi:chemotaxis protein CheR [Rhizobium sp. TH2]|uniref:CheR family methyltransferase n=1 Tax=Rhizobium sp. TH2 TaxID=2775403 RepID=UPI0021575BFE|nr:CheR family methyltransferase [Rhizobium sp. TH2]UVC06944.1 chemotaxis protein CheR [Rhizobium sp. TH2]